MKLGLFVSPLGGSKPPFGHSRKEVTTAAIIVGAASVAAAAAASISNASSVSSANEANKKNVEDTNATNLQIARETNELSQQQFNRNMEWSKEQFAAQRQYALEDREYNSIQNQVNRAIAAGINPAAVVGNGSAAHQTTPVSAVGTPSQSNFHAAHMEASHVEPTIYDFSGISEGVGHAVDAYNNSRMINAQIENTHADTQIKRADSFTRLAENIARVRKLYTENEALLQSNSLSEATRKKVEVEQEQIRQNMEYFESVKEDLAKGVRLGNSRVERELEHMDFEEMIQQYQIDIQRDLANSQISLNSANSALAIANKGKVAADTEGILYNNEVKAAADLVASTKAALDKAQQYYASVGKLVPLFGIKEYKDYKNALKHYNKVIYYSGKKHGGSKH